MSAERRHRRTALTTFRIPSDSNAITPEAWAAREPEAIWYGLPLEGVYLHPEGGTYRRCRVEAFNNGGKIIGYIPLPHRYAEAWTQLCYTIVYWFCHWKAWVREASRARRSRSQPLKMVRICIENSGTRLVKYLGVRLLIIDELLRHPMSKQEDEELDIFDEFLIRDRWDWLWKKISDVPDDMKQCLQLDPVHPMNKAIFSLTNPDLVVDSRMIAPAPNPTQTWVRGVINHFDFAAEFDAAFPDVVRYLSSKGYRILDDLPHLQNATLPRRWHEGHRPVPHFMTVEEDRHLQAAFSSTSHLQPVQPSVAQQQQPGPSLPANQQTQGSGASMQQYHHVGHEINDTAETRAVVEAFARPEGPMTLAAAHDALQALLGTRYDARQWGKLLDSVVAEPGMEPLMTIDEAFMFYGPDVNGGRVDEAGSGANFRELNMGFY